MIDVPRLDSIAFDALVEEGRGLIPRYAPDWTDHNLHDPGMTLLDLLAWIVDQQVYRIGFVSDAHIAAFAALLGVKRKAAVPARGLIWADPEAVMAEPTLEAGTRASPMGQPDLLFAIPHAVRLSPAKAKIAGGADTRFGKEGAIRLDEDAQTLEIAFDPALPTGTVSLGLAYGEPLPDLGDRAPASVAFPDGDGGWHRAGARWIAAAGSVSGALLVTLDREPVRRLRFDFGAGLPRRLLPVRIALNALPVVQVERLEGLKIGEGRDWPDLALVLPLGGGAIPEQEEGFLRPVLRSNRWKQPPVEWKTVADLGPSGPDDSHYEIDELAGLVRFGNSVNGRAPEADEEISLDPLHITRGAAGNVAAGTRWIVRTLDTGGQPFGINREPVAGGSDTWTAEEFGDEIRRRARLRTAMLTDVDLRAAANGLRGYGIAQADILARFLPTLPRRAVPGARTLLLRGRPGVASEAWLDAIGEALAPRRVLGERLSILAVEEVPVDVSAELRVSAGSDSGTIEEEAKQQLQRRLAAVKAEGEHDVEPWPSGRPVTIGELEALLASVPGVVAVIDLRLARSGEEPRRVSLPLTPTQVAVAGNVDVAAVVRS